MSEGKHTPGPWRWQIHDHSAASLGGDQCVEENHVLTVSPCKSCQKRAERWEWGRCLTPNEANAALIAAAPDMLEALEGLLEKYPVVPASQLLGDEIKEQSQRLSAARAAIAKAKGEDHD